MAQRLKLLTLPARTVTTSGTPVTAYDGNLEVFSAIIISLSTNTGTQYVGDSTMDTGDGMPIAPDGSLEMAPPDNVREDTFNLGLVYLDSSTNGAEFRIAAWVRG
jgi:hypothetical protein